ncbi:MAG TPA: 4-hydroxy-tetrahydrodipicolinate reductase [Actinomycetota bacterium]|nr:4-hydroxy-tetrahydrodipicolinate reductase [Actinomycetota bacterium]
MITVGVLGAAGRMGTAVCHAVDADTELELVARAGAAVELDALIEAKPAVAVEFTTPASVRANTEACVRAGIHVVVGATGLTSEDLVDIARLTDEHGANVFVAPNFAIGAVLMMRFAAEAARHFDTVEIIERHHENKLDAPSGTALRTASLMAESKGAPFSTSVGGTESIAGSRGGDADGIRIHSLRVPGSVAHQEVIFGAKGETLTIRHDSLDRACFMPGVVLAIKKIAATPGVTVGLEHLLGS